MLEFRFPDWSEELRKIVDEIYGITLNEFCEVKTLPKYYALGFSPIEAFEELDELYED